MNIVKGLLDSVIALESVFGRSIDENLKGMLKDNDLLVKALNKVLREAPESELVANMNFCGQVAILMHEELERRKVETKC